MIGRNDNCWCGSEKKWKKCHFPQTNPNAPKNYKHDYLRKYNILIKDENEIQGIRLAGQIASTILDEVCAMAKSGVTTLELNAFAEQKHKELGAVPAPLGYGHPPFPKSICTSLNDVICHGIPDDKPLKDGDILNIDVTAIYKGYYGDCSQMVAIGQISDEKKLVIDVSYDCLMKAIAILKPGIPVSEIGQVIEDYATSKGCSVVNQFVGHGVGINFHEGPQIPHNRNNNPILLVPGMTFTIEPMINAGVRDAVIDTQDQWTARTKDGRASAQWEHTLLITENGYEILTPWKRK